MVLLLQDFVFGAGKDQVAPGEQVSPENFDRRRGHDFIAAGCDHQNGLTNARGICRLC